MRSLGDLEELVAGAIGPPGKRVFYLRARTAGADAWFVVEKGQVASLAERTLELLRSRPPLPEAVAPSDLGEPGPVEFRVGAIAVGADETGFTFLLEPVEGDEGEPVSFRVEAARVRGMAEAALGVVAAGRPLCPFCNLPRDPEGHVCPATNGDRRHARP